MSLLKRLRTQAKQAKTVEELRSVLERVIDHVEWKLKELDTQSSNTSQRSSNFEEEVRHQLGPLGIGGPDQWPGNRRY